MTTMTMMISKLRARLKKIPPVDPILEELKNLQNLRARLSKGRNFNPARRELHEVYEDEIRNGTNRSFRIKSNNDIGPRVRIEASCGSCTFYENERIQRSVTGQPEEFSNVSRCNHSSVGGRELESHGNDTPSWCPYLSKYVEAIAERWMVPKPD
jgi:hypothetical protein